MTVEERKKNLLRLKQHVQEKITIEDKSGKKLKDKKLIPISNAFTLNIKNEKSQACKNMENLRRSVKLKKRANPLEKILTKLAMTDEEDET